MLDRRVTLVMTEHERDELVAALEAVIGDLAGTDVSTPADDQRVARHLERLRKARTGSWGQRGR